VRPALAKRLKMHGYAADVAATGAGRGHQLQIAD